MKIAFEIVTLKQVGEFSGKKIENPVARSNNNKIENQELVEEIVIPTTKNKCNIKQIKKSIIKLEHYKISKLWNDSTVSKFLTKKIDWNKWFIK